MSRSSPTARTRPQRLFRYALLIIPLLSLLLLYGALSESAPPQGAAERLTQQLSEILDAHERYRRDTGQVLPITADTRLEYGYLKIDNLVKDPGIAGWQGPYLPYNTDWRGRSQYLSHPDYSGIQLQAKTVGPWAKGSTANGCTRSSAACTVAACVWRVPMTLAQAINRQIDGVNNSASIDLEGRVRYENGTLLYKSGIVCLKGGPYPAAASPNP